MHLLGILATAIGVWWPVAAQPSREPAEDLARSVQTRYDATRAFSADFTHIYEGGALRKQITERGIVLIKKPGKMRWTYRTPERKLFISDGRTTYFYVPQDGQVIVSTVPADDQATTPALFLAGKGNLSRDFTVSDADVPGAPPETRAIKLVPRQPEREYEWLTLVVDDSKTIRMLVTVDAQGGRSTFTFSNIKENPDLSDKEFTFTIPHGVDVIREGSAEIRHGVDVVADGRDS